MSDERLRELERKWKESGSVEDEAAWLRHGLQTSVVSEDWLRLQAHLGSAGAKRALGSKHAAWATQHHYARPSGSQLQEVLLALQEWGAEVLAKGLVAAGEAQAAMENSRLAQCPTCSRFVPLSGCPVCAVGPRYAALAASEWLEDPSPQREREIHRSIWQPERGAADEQVIVEAVRKGAESYEPPSSSAL